MAPNPNWGRNRKGKIGRGAKIPRSLEERYGRALRQIVDEILFAQTRTLIDWFNNTKNEAEAQRRADIMQIEAAQKLTRMAERAVPDWFSAVDKYAASRFERSLKDALGIDAISLLDQGVYEEVRTTTIDANVGLIRNLSGEHYQDVRTAILADAQGLGFPGDAKSLAGRIQDIIGSTKERASRIARDQTAKLNGQMAQARQEDAGISQYRWRNQGDTRVVGNPYGLYPKGNDRHGNHWARNGRIFSWNNPPDDGHPGEAILCRCWAEPLIVPAKLNVQPAGARMMVEAVVF